MTHLYNRQQLEAMKRPQLWEIFDGVLIGYVCERGSGRRNFFTLTISANNQQTVKSSSANKQYDGVSDTDSVSPVTHEKVLLTTQ
jgi:hypothetical protein